MLLRNSHSFLLTGMLVISGLMWVNAQESIAWMGNYTSEMVIGNDTYLYHFTSVEGNSCKLEFKEEVTNKKGSTKARSWVFHLSDIDPQAIRFTTRGKSVKVTLETRGTQEFISYFEGEEFEEYTNKIILTMNEVDNTRELMEVLKEQIGLCKEEEAVWDERNNAINWLAANIGEVKDDEVLWEQSFSLGERPYLAKLISKSVDNGEEESIEYTFDLTDINPSDIKLEVSGRSLGIKVPVRDGKDYVEVNSSGNRQYSDELKIIADDIETARQMVNALTYVVSNTTAERPEWGSYQEALGFVKDHLGEVKIGDEVIQNSMSFDASPSGLAEINIQETGSDGEFKEVTYSFYLVDLVEKPSLDVSKKEIMVEFETRDDRDFIVKTSAGSVSGYESAFKFHATSIDVARDLINAFAYAIPQSEEEIQAFSTVNEVNTWMEENLVLLFREGEKYEQKIIVEEDHPNLISFVQKLTEDESGVTEKKYLIYPVDINLDKLKIGVSMGRLRVPLETTGKKDYIKYFINEIQEDFEDKVDVYFSDPLVAKNFMAAIRFLKEQAAGKGDLDMSAEEAMAFLKDNIPNIELPGQAHEQRLEMREGDPCKLKFMRVETDKEGKSDEFIYEFMAPDISEDNSEISVSKKVLEVNLETTGNKKLIKPFKNGEVEDFDDECTIYANDVWQAKQILSAFGVLSEGCN